MTKKLFILRSLIILLCLVCRGGPPELEITHPSDGSVVSGIVRINVEVTDIVRKVDFYINDSLEFTASSSPYAYIWNTFSLTDSTIYVICARAYSQDWVDTIADTISVVVYNGLILFADDFECYATGEYPSFGGWFEIWPGSGNGQTFIESGIAYSGNNSFRLVGTPDTVRTDGVELDLSNVNKLIYEFTLMIPVNSTAGTLVGFFVMLGPNLGTIHNGVLFNFQDSLIHVRGMLNPETTSFIWRHDTWHNGKVMIDYDSLKMTVWMDNELIAHDIWAAPSEMSDTFALATAYQTGGHVYYDDIKIYVHNESKYRR